MKRILLMLCGCTLFASLSFAQTDSTKTKSSKKHKSSTSQSSSTSNDSSKKKHNKKGGSGNMDSTATMGK